MRPARGERVDLVPEGAPRLRIDAGGGLVEQQQLRLVQRRRRRAPAAASSRPTACRPAACAARRGRAARARRRPARARRSRPRMRALNCEILLDGQVLVEREVLGHVAGAALDLPALGDDVEAQSACRCRCPGVSRPQSMRSVVVLPEPLGPRKPVIRPSSTWIEKSLTTRRPPNDLFRPSDVDRDGHGRRQSASTSTGRPGTSRGAVRRAAPRP